MRNDNEMMIKVRNCKIKKNTSKEEEKRINNYLNEEILRKSSKNEDP